MMMKNLRITKFSIEFFVLLIGFTSLCFGQCATNSNCTSCTSEAGCGWCTPTQQCLGGNANGPTTGACLGKAWQFGTGRCARCDQITDCRQCQANAADCGWCATSSACLPLSSFGAGVCQLATSCNCEAYRSCDECTEGPECNWCTNSATCSSTGCGAGPSYNSTVGCPCSVYGMCPTCLGSYGCQWCQNLQTCQPKGTNGTSCTIALGNCNGYCNIQGNGSCSACTKLLGCGWCESQQKCVDSRVTGCNLTQTCQTCDLHNYCDPCLDEPGCKWCQDTKTCTTAKYGPACFTAHTCPDYCNLAGSCGACISRKGCGWCSSSNICVDLLTSTCGVQTCDPTPINPPTKCGFDGGAFVGGMFLVIGLIVLGAIVFIVYRWRSGRKILYTELR